MGPLAGFAVEKSRVASQAAEPRKVRLIHPAIGEITFAIGERRQVIGRSEADIELSWDTRVSRRHALIWMQDGLVWLEDLGSRNGSWIGETRLQAPIRLENGVSVLIGETVIALDEASSDEPWKGEDTNPGVEAPVTPPRPSSTDDLRNYLAIAPAPKKVKPRFVQPDRVEVVINDRSLLGELWVRELSKGGLFVETRESLRLGQPIDVHLQTADGSITISASVVHSQPTGVGLQLNGVTSEMRLAIQSYATAMAPRLEVANKPAAAQVQGSQDVLRKAKLFLDWVDRSDLYSALEIPPSAGESRISARIKELRAAFQAAKQSAPAPAAARLERALQVLDRIEPRLNDPQLRLQYDFRSGHVRSGERLRAAASKSGPSIPELRRAWLAAAPEAVDRAAFLTRQAFAARQRGAISEAVSAAKQALEHNPFFEELRTSIKAWEDQEKKRRA